jgi:MFS transporter, PPP family, 3-phenylpropionic acid transporter
MTGNRIKAMYLILYTGFAVWRVFFNVYLEDVGLSGTEIGTINAIFQATLVFILPVWGFVADKQGIRPTLRWLVFFTSILLFFLGHITTFWILVFYIPLLTIFYHPMGPLTDALAIQFSELNPKYNYGIFRSWGSLGWAIASIVGGYIFTRIDVKYVFPTSSIFFIVLLFFLITRKRKTIYRPNFQPIELKLLLKNHQLLAFIVILVLYGIACAPVNSFTNLYFRELGAKNSTIGMAYAIQAFSEVPFFIIGSKLVARLGSKRVILLSMFVMMIRMFIYGLFPGIVIGLLLGVLQGITLSFFLVGAVDYMYQLLPAGRHATAQSFIWGMYFGLGHTIGNLSIGILKDIRGMVVVMKIFAVLTLIVLLITSLYFVWRRKRQRQLSLFS